MRRRPPQTEKTAAPEIEERALLAKLWTLAPERHAEALDALRNSGSPLAMKTRRALEQYVAALEELDAAAQELERIADPQQQKGGAR